VNYKQHFKLNTKLALPVMLSQLGHVMVGVADSVMVGQLGTAELAAVSLGGAPFFLVMLFGIGISYGVTPLVAAEDGNGNHSLIRDYLKHAIVLNFIIGILLFLLIYLSAPLLGYLDQDPEVVKFALPYLYIIASSLIPLLLFQAFRQFCEGLSLTKQAMYISVGANLLNVVLNYVLIYGKWGFPELGLNGAAWATLISRIIMALMMAYYVFSSRRFKIYIDTINFREYTNVIWVRILKIGVPSGLQFIFEVGAFAMAAIMVGWLGAEALAAHQIALNLAGITYMTASGISAAATIRVGNQMGKRDFATLRRAGYTCFIMAAIFMAICAIIFITANEQLPRLYIDNEEVIKLTAQLLLIAAVFQISDGVQVVGLGALRGLSDVKIPTVVTMVSFWFFAIPLGYFLGFNLKMGTIGIWIGLLTGLTLAAIAHLIRFEILTKKLKYG
jgi:MATE family multidrug resistance protein